MNLLVGWKTKCGGVLTVAVAVLLGAVGSTEAASVTYAFSADGIKEVNAGALQVKETSMGRPAERSRSIMALAVAAPVSRRLV